MSNTRARILLEVALSARPLSARQLAIAAQRRVRPSFDHRLIPGGRAAPRHYEKAVAQCVDLGYLDRTGTLGFRITPAGLWTLASHPYGRIDDTHTRNSLSTMRDSPLRDILLMSLNDFGVDRIDECRTVASFVHWHNLSSALARSQEAGEGVAPRDTRQLSLPLRRRANQGVDRANTGGSTPSPRVKP